jgi:hypothetical protein
LVLQRRMPPPGGPPLLARRTGSLRPPRIPDLTGSKMLWTHMGKESNLIA